MLSNHRVRSGWPSPFPAGVSSIITYGTVGADDMVRAERFYPAFLPTLNYELAERTDSLSYALPKPKGQAVTAPDFYVKAPFNEFPASAGNGAMVAFKARSRQQVRDLHAAASAAGGSDDGAPGFRDLYGPRFYVGYLRAPQGNKIALYSNGPDEPQRGE